MVELIWYFIDLRICIYRYWMWCFKVVDDQKGYNFLKPSNHPTEIQLLFFNKKMVKTGIQTKFFYKRVYKKFYFFWQRYANNLKTTKVVKKIEAKKHTRALSRQKKNYVYMKWVNDVFDRLIYYTISLYHKNHLFKQNGERVFFINSSDTAIL
jgi:hypothetical protein